MFFDKKLSVSIIKNRNMLDEQIAEELHKPFIKKIEKRKAHSSFKYNIWGADLADIQLIGKFNKGIHFLLYYWYFQ